MIFVILIDIGMLLSAAYTVYWQSQITLRARYNFWPAVFGILLASWVIATPYTNNWPYIIFASAFILLNIMNGVGGIGSKRLMTTGFFSRLIAYQNFSEITLIPIDLPGGHNRVVAIFMTLTQQRVQLTFNQTVETIRTELEKYIPDSVKINIQNIDQLR